MVSRPRVLFTTPLIRYPAMGGPFLRIENTINVLSGLSDLTLYSRVTFNDPAGLEYYASRCRAFHFAPSAPGFGKVPPAAETEEDFDELLNIAEAVCADVVWLGYGNISYPLLHHIKARSDIPVVVDTDSVWSRFVLRELPLARDTQRRLRIKREGRRKQEEERRGTQVADITTAVSEVDALYYRSLTDDPGRVQIFSNVIDPKAYRDPPPAPPGFRTPALYLAGTFGPGSPMEDAARWTIQYVFPRVRAEIPGVHFYLVGSGSTETLSDLDDPSITVTGLLPTVLPYLCHSAVSLVPLRFESGTRFKILEAGACGMPVVSTRLGAEGIDVTDGRDILIADEPDAFSMAILRLIRERAFAETLGRNLKALVERDFSLATLARQGRRILDRLAEKR